MMKQWHFEAIDTWFFREMRPIDELTGAELGSLFPPPVRTLAGAVRGLIGERAGVNWAAYRAGDGKAHSINGLNLCEQLGDPRCEKGEEEFGKLKLSGPYLLKDNKRLYPVPQHLLKDEHDNFHWLKPGEPLCCDLGKVRLPVVSPETNEKVKPLNAWVDVENLQKISRHEEPDKIYYSTDLFTNETRVGIGLNRDQRTTIDGLLYQTRHVRPCEGVSLGIEVAGIDEQLELSPNETHTVRLGGEGRIASVSLGKPEILPKIQVAGDKIVLILLTPLLVPEKGEFFMPFEDARKEKESDGADVWHVTLNGVGLKIISAVLGKPQREGGWNLAKNQSRPLRSLVPAGSVWFCQVLKGEAQTLHGYKIGEETALGRGELAVGHWDDK